jgi:hypothetical protein
MGFAPPRRSGLADIQLNVIHSEVSGPSISASMPNSRSCKLPLAQQTSLKLYTKIANLHNSLHHNDMGCSNYYGDRQDDGTLIRAADGDSDMLFWAGRAVSIRRFATSGHMPTPNPALAGETMADEKRATVTSTG